MNTTRLAAFLLTTGLALPGLVLPAAAEQGPAEADPLYDFITALSAESPVRDVLYDDLDRDGETEAVVILAPVGDAAETEWRYLDMQDGAPAVRFAWIGEDIRIEETEGDGRVVWSDGITFAATPAGLVPYFDLIRQNVAFMRNATEAEVKVFHDLGYPEASSRFAQAVKAEITPSPGSEVVISLSDEVYADTFYATPYVILTAAGELIQSGVSQYHPSIFPDPRGWVNVIESRETGYTVYRLGAISGE